MSPFALFLLIALAVQCALVVALAVVAMVTIYIHKLDPGDDR